MSHTAADELFPILSAPDSRPALHFGSDSLGYASLAIACASHRRKLAECGIAPGDRVAVWAQPALQTLVALIGNAVTGVISIPLNPSLGDEELKHILQDAEPELVLSACPEQDAPRTPKHTVYDLDQLDDGSLVTPRSGPYTRPEEPLLILYTSGTTGKPKGAVLSGANIASNLDGLITAWGLTRDDTVVHALPVFHAHGLIFGLFGALRAGAALHWAAPFRPESLAAALEGESRVLCAVPTMYRRLCDAAETDDRVRQALAGARLLISGSAALPEREHARIERLAGQRPIERYGLTETLINTSIRHDGDRRAGYVGLPLDGVELRLVDDQRTPLDARDGTTMGEIAVRGPNVFVGYLNRPDATAEIRDREGWFYTGDLATMDEDGYVRIVGRRATDLIKTGGFKVGAGEVEGALMEHPAVSEVAVIGVPDDDLGERIVAYVVASGGETPSAQELVEHCKTQVSKHKCPREVRFVDALPRNAMGKVQKARLRSGTP